MLSPPRLHDLPQAFAVGTLLRWYREGTYANCRLIHRSMFPGHVDPNSTAVYLPITEKAFRPGSIRSYRDTLKLFLVHVASLCRRSVTRLAVGDLAFERVLDFLRMIEETRRNQAFRVERLVSTKWFQLTKRVKLRIDSQFFKVFNDPNFGLPDLVCPGRKPPPSSPQQSDEV